jgi:hypothetical protein
MSIALRFWNLITNARKIFTPPVYLRLRHYRHFPSEMLSECILMPGEGARIKDGRLEIRTKEEIEDRLVTYVDERQGGTILLWPGSFFYIRNGFFDHLEQIPLDGLWQRMPLEFPQRGYVFSSPLGISFDFVDAQGNSVEDPASP